MKELDFDELDKAVNSLMGGVSKSETPDQPKDNVLDVSTQSTTSAAAPTPLSEPHQPTSESDKAEPDRPTPPPAPRQPQPPTPKRRGRFMDVVPPSASTKPRTASPPTPNRVGVTIAPRPEAESSSEASTTAPSSPPPAAPQTLGPIKPDTAQQSWPDPLDLAKPENSSVESPEAPEQEPSQPAAPGAPAPPKPASDAGSASPFLSNAKVEKRPLGSDLAEKLASEADQLEKVEGETPVIEPNSKETDEPPAQPLQPELNNDLLSIESSELTDTVKPEQKPASPAQPAASEKASTPTPFDHRLADHGSAQEASTAPHMTSITQQYKEQASSGDQSHSAIYDTNGYPEPMAHPAKKKASWLWIIWVLLLLVLGAGGAVILYLLHII